MATPVPDGWPSPPETEVQNPAYRSTAKEGPSGPSFYFRHHVANSATPRLKPAEVGYARRTLTAELEILPDTPSGKKLQWVLSGITKGGELPSLSLIEESFNEKFLRAFDGAEGILRIFSQLQEQLGEGALDRLVETDDPKDEGYETVVVALALGKLLIRISLTTEEAVPNKISGLWLRPAPELMEGLAASWDEVSSELGKLAERTNLIAAEVVGDELAPIHSVGEDRYLAIGSTFKLYVLGALGEAVLQGEIDWSDEIAIRDEWKAIPSGVLQNEDEGTNVTVEEMATKMISISDNTATDHLMHTLGRAAAEAYMSRAQHSKPKLNTPFMSTREMTILKLGMSSEERDAYVARGADERREFLDDELAKQELPLLEDEQSGWVGGRHVETIEWFASPIDLARVMVSLRADMGHPVNKPIRSILGTNPGLVFDRRVWPYVGFKGGGEPGVLSMTWLMLRRDLRWFVLSMTLNDDSGEVGRWDSIALATACAKLLGEHTKPPADEDLI